MKKKLYLVTKFSLTQFGVGIYPYKSGLINNLVDPPKIFKRYSLSFLVWPLTIVIHFELGEDPWTSLYI